MLMDFEFELETFANCAMRAGPCVQCCGHNSIIWSSDLKQHSDKRGHRSQGPWRTVHCFQTRMTGDTFTKSWRAKTALGEMGCVEMWQ